MGSKRPRRKAAATAKTTTPTSTAATSCAWTFTEERELLDFLVLRKSQQGESGSFKKAVFNDTAAHIAAHRVKGAVKTGTACGDKYRALKRKYEGVRAVKNYSGLEYSEENGANIGPSTEHIWEELLAAEPRIAPFKNSGWSEELYSKMLLLVTAKPKGSHVFNGATDASAQVAEVNTSPNPQPNVNATNTEASPEDDDSDSSSSSASSTPPQSRVRQSVSAPAAPAPSAPTTPPSVSAAKRAHRAFDSASETKRPRMTPMSKSVMGFGEEFKSFSTLMHDVLQPDASSGLEATPKRKSRAMERAQTSETWLDDSNLIRLLRVLETDSNAADAYLTLKKDSLREAWVKDRLNL